MSIKRLEEASRRDLLRGKVVQAAIAGANVSDDEVKAAYTAEHEGAAIAWVRFNPFMFRDKVSASDAEVEEFAKSHGDGIAKRYEGEKATRWPQPAAMKVRAITIPVPPNASGDQEKAAREKIDRAAAEVKGGKDFAEVAKARSEDRRRRRPAGTSASSPAGSRRTERPWRIRPSG